MNWIAQYGLRFVLLVVLQMVFVGKMAFFGAFASVNILPFLLLISPFNANRVHLLGLAFLSGLIADSFNATYGLYAMGMSLTAYALPLVTRVILSRDELELNKNGVFDFHFIKAMGISALPVFIFHLTVYNLGHFSWDSFFIYQAKALVSTLLTLLFILIIVLTFPLSHKRRR